MRARPLHAGHAAASRPRRQAASAAGGWPPRQRNARRTGAQQRRRRRGASGACVGAGPRMRRCGARSWRLAHSPARGCHARACHPPPAPNPHPPVGQDAQVGGSGHDALFLSATWRAALAAAGARGGAPPEGVTCVKDARGQGPCKLDKVPTCCAALRKEWAGPGAAAQRGRAGGRLARAASRAARRAAARRQPERVCLLVASPALPFICATSLPATPMCTPAASPTRCW